MKINKMVEMSRYELLWRYVWTNLASAKWVK